MSKDKRPERPNASTRPARRWAVCVYIAVSITAVVVTVLLSNDYRNLRLVGSKLGFNTQPQAIQNVSVTVKRMNTSGPAFRYDPYLVSTPDISLSAAFIRIWRVSGPEMCRSMRLAGIEMSEWSPSALGGEAYECSTEAQGDVNAGASRSVFIMIRGNAAGDVSSARIKMVNPRIEEGRLGDDDMAPFLAVLSQPLWLNLDETLDKIRTLNAVDEQKLGTTITFEREYSNPSNFNFILTLRGANVAQERTEAYFSRRKWLFGDTSSQAGHSN
jgi:hypothetical protein